MAFSNKLSLGNSERSYTNKEEEDDSSCCGGTGVGKDVIRFVMKID
jgi:hypothetical protein